MARRAPALGRHARPSPAAIIEFVGYHFIDMAVHVVHSLGIGQFPADGMSPGLRIAGEPAIFRKLAGIVAKRVYR
jgi:hypothetical protein